MSYLTDRLRFYLADEGGFLGGLIGPAIGAIGGLLGGGGQKQTAQTQNTLPSWAQDYLKNSAGIAGRHATGIGGGNPLVGGLDPLQQQGAAAAQQGLGQAGDIFGFGQNLANSAMPGAMGYDPSQYANPYLDQQRGFAAEDFQRALAMNRMQNQQGATAAGAYGGTRHGLAEGIGAGEATRGYMRDLLGMQQQDWTQQHQFGMQGQGLAQNMMNMGMGAMGQGLQGQYQGAGMLGGFGSEFRNVGNQQLQDPYMRAQAEMQLRRMGSDQFGLMQGTTGQQTQNQGSWLSRMMGGAATGAGIAGMFGGGGSQFVPSPYEQRMGPFDEAL